MYAARAHPYFRLVAFAIVATLGACGDDKPLTAIDLTSGKVGSFSSAGDVPSGWAICGSDGCNDAVGSVPCQNLTEQTCNLNPGCVLIDGPCAFPGSAGGSDGQQPGQPTDPSQPPKPVPPPDVSKCQKVCVPSARVVCGQIADAQRCSSEPSCQWLSCPPCPNPTGACPPCLEGCVDAQPLTCQQLDQQSCTMRPDCVWQAQTCPSCPAGVSCTCPAFCQPASTGCPAVSPPPPNLCPNGDLFPVLDANGCVIDYKCQDKCPAVPMPAPHGCKGKLTTRYDARGCVIGYSCDPVVTPCDQLMKAYVQAIDDAKRCDDATAPTACSVLFDDALICGCPTYVNAEQKVAIDKLRQLSKSFRDAGCSKDLQCPAVTCKVANGAKCLAIPTPGQPASSARCTDAP
jgi:hypothetical protein